MSGHTKIGKWSGNLIKKNIFEIKCLCVYKKVKFNCTKKNIKPMKKEHITNAYLYVTYYPAAGICFRIDLTIIVNKPISLYGPSLLIECGASWEFCKLLFHLNHNWNGRYSSSTIFILFRCKMCALASSYLFKFEGHPSLRKLWAYYISRMSLLLSVFLFGLLLFS